MIPRKKRLERHTALKAKRRDSLTRRTRMRQVSKKRKTRVGKLGIVRLVGEELEKLRSSQYARFGGACQLRRDDKCHRHMPLEGSVFVRAHLVHIRNKRMYGDTVQNTTIGCYHCHIEIDHTKGVPQVSTVAERGA